jgi:hypothetical protein
MAKGEATARTSHSRRQIGNRDTEQKANVALAFYVPAEHNIEVIGYFSAGYKRRYPQPSEAKTVRLTDRETGLERQIKIIASAYGYPNSTDLDFYRAFLRICDEQIEMVPCQEKTGEVVIRPQFKKIPIAFTTNQMLRYAGFTKSAPRWKEANTFLKRLAFTGIEGHIYLARERKFEMMTTTLFRDVYTRGEKLRNGKVADMNYVVPGPWLLSNYYYYYFHRIDIALHQRLETPIAKSLLPILNTGWYAARGQSYAKRYSDLAALLFIPCWEHLSWVKKQLDPAHEELREEKFLAAWEYETTPRGDWSHVIRWWPGEKWFFDQQEHQRRRNAVTEKNTAASQFLLLPPTMPEVKPSQSAPAVTSEEDDPRWNRVREFYTMIGQERVSIQKVREGVSTLALLEQEGYRTSDVDAALEWIVKHRKTRFGGDVHSIRLVIKVIGQALKEQ